MDTNDHSNNFRDLTVALVSAPGSIHTIRWANGLASIGQRVHLIGLDPKQPSGLDDRVVFHSLNPDSPTPRLTDYLFKAGKLRSLIREIKPDLVNSHYVSNYSAAATLALIGLKIPHLLSVWGSDVYEFPYRSKIHETAVKMILSRATSIGSTSKCMAAQTRKFTKKPIDITPFGIDMELFSRTISVRTLAATSEDPLVIGTVKTMEDLYGIDTLIRAFALLKTKVELPMELHLYGRGSQIANYQTLADGLGVGHLVKFFGQIDHAEVPKALETIDIFVALSHSESFGVAVLEAGSMKLPVVASDAEGLSEVILDTETGFVVPKDNPQAACNALAKLVTDQALRIKMGESGYAHVAANYSWSRSLDLMCQAQQHCLAMADR